MRVERFVLRAVGAGMTLMVAAQGWAQETRMLETTFGEVEVPTNPTRIVSTHGIASFPLVELGVIPVGMLALPENYTPPDILEQVADVPSVVNGSEINLEAVVAANPDLIFASNRTPDDVLERLRQIAPVVVVGLSGEDRANWRNRARQIADAVNALDRWAELEAEFEMRQAALAQEYGSYLAENPIAIWSSWTEGMAHLYPSASLAGPILEPAGAVFSENAETLPYEGREPGVSLEELPTMLGDASIVFYLTDYQGAQDPIAGEIRETELYDRIPAVAGDREYPMASVVVAGYANALYVLDSFEDALEDLTAPAE